MKYYYDVVASICNEFSRVDSHLIMGGLDSESAALDYINEYNVSEADYYGFCRDDETAYIEIEMHDESGNCLWITTVD